MKGIQVCSKEVPKNDWILKKYIMFISFYQRFDIILNDLFSQVSDVALGLCLDGQDDIESFLFHAVT